MPEALLLGRRLLGGLAALDLNGVELEAAAAAAGAAAAAAGAVRSWAVTAYQMLASAG
eukprot:CAMPEP_0202372928 /NCGR_PEP_ID=MMETSP1127-20130417/4044_1 /ASSEMBLY_ACC=CAM_ASM_000462 /TAXON_ID=3047 /ORGANISM="Dunaliella tertiolecta, Strain CCMP1320" /LENGTH=57 /DNA_ID=CAMNT_0048969639 /DNA_START=1185 /DNA_END=1355 /DNA_ORIENTATION=+